ncbi:MAG TPA: efflux RND transporter periplasmic adaptor subunit [Myxococcota bacterium]|nr:efflux RND transporter periplasmic adaptor subunit [Myxococcota bacterium]
MAAEAPRNLRDELTALRIDRDTRRAKKQRRLPPTRWLAGGGAAAALLVALIAWLALSGATPVDVAYASRVETGSAAPAVSVLSGSGYVVTADKYISIGVRIPGRIEKFYVDESDHVKKGDPLVKLDDRDYRAALESQKARLAVVHANMDLHKLQLERQRKLRAANYASQAELDTAETQLRVDAAQVGQLEADIAQSEVNLDYTVLRAPADGVILAKLKEIGEMAVPGGFSGSGDLIRMANLSDLRAEVDVAEADLSRVRLGQPAAVTPDAYPDKRYDAKVVKLYPQVNRAKGTLKIEVSIPNPDEYLLPDMSVRIQFLSGDQPVAPGGPPLVLAPKTAVRTDSGGTYAWVVTGGKLRRQALKTGGDRGDQVIVAEGLSGGEALVVGDAAGMSDGRRVKTLGAR